MAQLTHLDEKLAEVLGLAQAAQTATKKVATLARNEKETELVQLMQQMSDEAAKLEQRCDVAEVVDFMKTYLEDAEALDGPEFLSMAEAGEMAHWEILAKLNETASDKDVAGVGKFAVPLRRAHVDAIRERSLRLAAAEDPSEPA